MMATENRHERHIMRQRGAGARELKTAQFGFSFGAFAPTLPPPTTGTARSSPRRSPQKASSKSSPQKILSHKDPLPEPPRTVRKRSATVSSIAAPTTSKRRKIVKEPIVEADLVDRISPLKQGKSVVTNHSGAARPVSTTTEDVVNDDHNFRPTKPKRGRAAGSKTTSVVKTRGRPAKLVVDATSVEQDLEQEPIVNEFKASPQEEIVQPPSAMRPQKKSSASKQRSRGKAVATLSAAAGPEYVTEKEGDENGGDEQLSRAVSGGTKRNAARRGGRAPVYVESEDEEKLEVPQTRRTKAVKEMEPADRTVRKVRGRPVNAHKRAEDELLPSEELPTTDENVQVEAKQVLPTATKPAIKRRGRPPTKMEERSDLTKVNDTIVRAPRPGRTAKTKIQASEARAQFDDDEDPVVPAGRDVARNAPVSHDSTRDPPVKPAETAEPKRRGRPKKVVSVTAPTKVVLDEDLVETASKPIAEDGASVKAQDKRGKRKRKEPLDISSPNMVVESVEDVMTETTEPVVAESASHASTEEQHVEPAKKRRGRPPKATVDVMSAADADARRPRRIHTEPVDEKTTGTEILQDEAHIETGVETAKPAKKYRTKKAIKLTNLELHDQTTSGVKNSAQSPVHSSAYAALAETAPEVELRVATDASRPKEIMKEAVPQKPMPLSVKPVNIRSPSKARAAKPVLPMFKMGSRRRAAGAAEWQKEDWFEPSVPASLLR